MALFSECTDRYAQNMLDTADIVREAIYRQPSQNFHAEHSDVSSKSAYDERQFRAETLRPVESG